MADHPPSWRIAAKRAAMNLPIIRGILRQRAKLDRALDDLAFIKSHMSSYLGEGIALTYLRDGAPFFVNSNDFGGPMNMISGGVYEDENLIVLQSFVRPDSIFLDIGANLGFFALAVARRLGPAGRAIAFEPNKPLCDIMHRSAFLNGVTDRLVINNFGLSDHEGPVTFNAPVGHMGGNSLVYPSGEGFVTIHSELRMLDRVLPPDMAVDLIKLDVQGHEPEALRGMRAVIARSPDLKILFESDNPEELSAGDLAAPLIEAGMHTYGVRGDATLIPLSGAELAAWSGYVLAARPHSIGDQLDRNRFSIYPAQLRWPGGQPPRATGQDRDTLFCGPYWFLPRGAWTITVHGRITGRLRLQINERYGLTVLAQDLPSGATSISFRADHDLLQFECAAFADGGPASVELERLDLLRTGP